MKVIQRNLEEDRKKLVGELLTELPRLSAENRQIARDYIKAVETKNDQNADADPERIYIPEAQRAALNYCLDYSNLHQSNSPGIAVSGVLVAVEKMLPLYGHIVPLTVIRQQDSNEKALTLHSNSIRPGVAEKFLWLLPKHIRDPLLGDLEENYPITCQKFGWRYARFWYWWQVLTSIGFSIVRVFVKMAKFY